MRTRQELQDLLAAKNSMMLYMEEGVEDMQDLEDNLEYEILKDEARELETELRHLNDTEV